MKGEQMGNINRMPIDSVELLSAPKRNRPWVVTIAWIIVRVVFRWLGESWLSFRPALFQSQLCPTANAFLETVG
jgi:hypothetical protein